MATGSYFLPVRLSYFLLVLLTTYLTLAQGGCNKHDSPPELQQVVTRARECLDGGLIRRSISVSSLYTQFYSPSIKSRRKHLVQYVEEPHGLSPERRETFLPWQQVLKRCKVLMLNWSMSHCASSSTQRPGQVFTSYQKHQWESDSWVSWTGDTLSTIPRGQSSELLNVT